MPAKMQIALPEPPSLSLAEQIEACRADARLMFTTEMWCEKDDFLFRLTGGKTLRVRNDGDLSWEIVPEGDRDFGVMCLPPIGWTVNAFWD